MGMIVIVVIVVIQERLENLIKTDDFKRMACNVRTELPYKSQKLTPICRVTLDFAINFRISVIDVPERFQGLKDVLVRTFVERGVSRLNASLRER